MLQHQGACSLGPWLEWAWAPCPVPHPPPRFPVRGSFVKGGFSSLPPPPTPPPPSLAMHIQKSRESYPNGSESGQALFPLLTHYRQHERGKASSPLPAWKGLTLGLSLTPPEGVAESSLTGTLCRREAVQGSLQSSHRASGLLFEAAQRASMAKGASPPQHISFCQPRAESAAGG